VPQAEAVSPVVHWLPRQQPFGQFEGPQLVTCISQIPLVQVKLVGHVWQAPPALPQSVVAAPVWHVPLTSQQPLQLPGPQGVGAQKAPPTGPGPPPKIWQVRPAVHVMQLTPPMPQSADVLPAWQTPLPSQQPFGQVVGLHTGVTHVPPWQRSVVGQTLHFSPPVPQPAALSPVVQEFPLQHPFGQLEGPQLVTGCSHRPPPVVTDWQVKFVAHDSQLLPLLPH